MILRCGLLSTCCDVPREADKDLELSPQHTVSTAAPYAAPTKSPLAKARTWSKSKHKIPLLCVHLAHKLMVIYIVSIIVRRKFMTQQGFLLCIIPVKMKMMASTIVPELA